MINPLVLVIMYFLPDIVLRLDRFFGEYHRKFMDRAYTQVAPSVKIFITYLPYFRFYRKTLKGYNLMWEGAQAFFEELLFFALPSLLGYPILMASAVVWAMLHVALHSLPYLMYAPRGKTVAWVMLQAVAWIGCGFAIATMWASGLGALSIIIHIIVNTLASLKSYRSHEIPEIYVEKEETYFPAEDYFPKTPHTALEYIYSKTSPWEWVWGQKPKKQKPRQRKAEAKQRKDEFEYL